MANTGKDNVGGWTPFDDYALLITILFAVLLWWLWVIGLGPQHPNPPNP